MARCDAKGEEIRCSDRQVTLATCWTKADHPLLLLNDDDAMRASLLLIFN